MKETGQRKSPILAAVLSIIPGLGQVYNGQKIKGVLFLLTTALFIFELLLFGIPAFENLVTLGTEPLVDHSLFLLIEGTLQLIITIIFIFFWALNIRDLKLESSKIQFIP
ncbi:hypothetical protein [Tetragenococcus halophilus]|uniref:hypothetical protein n=1 Tax=Tetragenococcus halophilus TaxID=51669 RepID=UPI000B9269E4|nr:hypothetical protein [Tetragenococcus halophilus]